jgi:hypothetical protein
MRDDLKDEDSHTVDIYIWIYGGKAEMEGGRKKKGNRENKF